MRDISITCCKNCRLQQQFTLFVCIFTCVFAFSCCVYCTWLVHMSSCRSKNEENIAWEETMIATPSRQKSTVQQSETAKPQSRPERSLDNKKTRHKAKKSKSKAAHYITDVYGHYQQIPDYRHHLVSAQCINITDLGGTLCGDESFTPNGDILNIFTKASWVDRKKSPFKILSDGRFEARYNGVYLVYAQLLALDDGDSRKISLIQTRKDKKNQTVMCFESFKIKDKSLRFKTCGITALFSVMKKDIFVIQNWSHSPKLSLREGANYIGAIVLK